jgi:2-(1,2-epoxy-1,2-dihydrophenyl)acetyl-CoA isomerase
MIKIHPHVETERLDDVLVIRLANEKARNALTREMRFSLRDIVREIEDDTSIRSVLLTARGGDFCSGGDLRMLMRANEPWAVHRRFRHAATVFPPLMLLNRPVVCAVRGHALGAGLGLALMADQIVAGESAKFSAGFFRVGVVPDGLTLFALPRLVGLARARNFLYGEGGWDARTAFDLGIAAKVVPDAAVEAEGLALARTLASGPAEVMGLAKRILLKSFESSATEMMDYEDFGQVLAQSSAEFREGLKAIVEKRRPDHAGAAKAAKIGDGLPSSE